MLGFLENPSIANVNCLKANGKYEEKVKRQRKRNRLSNVSFNNTVSSLMYTRN